MIDFERREDERGDWRFRPIKARPPLPPLPSLKTLAEESAGTVRSGLEGGGWELHVMGPGGLHVYNFESRTWVHQDAPPKEM